MIPGEVFCDPGFAAKIRKLSELGCDLTDLQWLSDHRNKTFITARSVLDTVFIPTSTLANLISRQQGRRSNTPNHSNLDIDRRTSTE